MNDSIQPHTPPLLERGSPPPKCAICLGVCNNKCFSDSCMHEFCFSCLMEWSKIKAECPLCKKQFKSILHNIKSNDDYEEYIVADNAVETPGPFLEIEPSEFLYLPPVPSRHFQFRTTFTVETGGELAIQQMLLSHPLTTNNYNVPLPTRYRPQQNTTRRGVSSATSFRQSIYELNLWVSGSADLVGHYRDIRPEFFRDNPMARNRLVPWLNRELNAILHENTQQVMMVVDIILEHLPRWHIRSRAFRNLLLIHMNDKTDHFLHEFYSFMRSPFDMIGYDRHIAYAEQPTTYTFAISDYDDDDSDVAIINVSEPITIDNNPFRQPTLEVIEIHSSDSSHESDVIIRDAPVEVVDLLHSDSDISFDDVTGGRTPTAPFEQQQSDSSDHTKPLLPLKIRLKRKQQPQERSNRKKKRTSKRYSSCSTCPSSSDTSDSSSSSSDSSYCRSKKRRKYKKVKLRSYKDYKKMTKDKSRTRKYKRVEPSRSSTTTSYNSNSSASGINSRESKKRITSTFDSDDNIPLSRIRNKEIQNKSSHTVTSKMAKNTWHNSVSNDQSQPSCSMWQDNLVNPPRAVPDDYPYTYSSNSVYNVPLSALQRFSVSTRPSSSYQANNSGMSDYQRPRVSFTPPVDQNTQFYNNNHTPLCVNVGVGTSPIQDLDSEDDYSSHFESCSNSSNSAPVQSVIVKKEQKTQLLPLTFVYENNSSDSNN